MRSGASAALLRSNPAWTGGSPPAVVSSNHCKPTCTMHVCRGKEVAVLKERALAAAARAQAVRGVRAPHVGEAAGGDLAEGNHSGAAGDRILLSRDLILDTLTSVWCNFLMGVHFLCVWPVSRKRN